MSQLTRVAVTGVIILLVGLIGVTSLQAGALAQTSRPPRDDTAQRFQPISQDPDPSLAQPSSVVATAGYGAWSKIVFQSYRDSNWEIYIANGDGSGQTRLTANTASDTYPRLNRGGTRIAFVSNRTGNYELYTMNPDGSGLAQLTFSTANEYNPAWSPDGSKIAFNSYRDGQSEIYVINANGTGLLRLTNHTAYDGFPAWSPDGKRIAFTSDRGAAANTGNRVWVMNVDGSAPKQLSTQAYSQTPIWSPDGTRLAYDADADLEGSQEIWLMNANGSGQTQVYNPPNESPLGYPGLTDAWVRSWSPDGNFIAFTRLTWIYYQGTWYWYTGYLEDVDTVNFGASRLVPTQGDDWYPDWQTLDISAPSSSILTLAQYSRASGTNIKWSGQDAGIAGILNYDVQYRFGTGGSWMNWRTTAATSSIYTGTPGTTVYFRSRARDNAGNLEAWPSEVNSDAYTTLYTQQLNGNVTDNRGVPLPHVSIPITPVALNTIDTDRSGRFTAYLAITDSYTFVPNHVGYGMLPTSTLTANADRSIDLHLPPVDNIIQNGGLEDGSSAGWESSGITPTVQAVAAHTGHYGAVLGQSFLKPANFQVAADNSGATTPALAYDLTGTLHIVWVDRGSPTHIHYASCTPAHLCQAAQLPFVGTLPKISIGPDGVVHLIYIQDGITVMYADRTAGTWSAAQSIGTSGNWYNGNASIAVDSQSRPHVVWNDNRMIYYTYRQNASTWAPTEQISSDGVTPVIAISSNDDVHVAWSGGYAWSWTSYRRKPAGGDWEASIPLYQGYYMTSPALAVDHNNQPHIAWLESLYPAHVIYTHRHLDGTWSPQSSIPGMQSNDLKLAVRADDTVIVSWIASRYFTYLFPDGSTWSPTYTAFDSTWGGADDGWTALALKPVTEDVAMATFAPVNGQWSVYAAEFQLQVEQADRSRLRQSITIPIDLHHPTLSWLYKYTSEEPTGNEPFNVSIDDGVQIITVLTQTTSMAWKHVWLDAEPWAGQTITITFDVSSTVANGRYSSATIDEVSLGSWLTPLPLMVTPDQIEADASTVITITGDNFLAMPQIQIGNNAVLDVHLIDTTILTATVPALAFGQYEVRVTNPGGQTNVAPRNLIVGKLVYLPIVTKSPF